MKRSGAFVGVIGILSFCAFGACDSGPETVAPPAGWVPGDGGTSTGDNGGGTDGSTSTGGDDDSGSVTSGKDAGKPTHNPDSGPSTGDDGGGTGGDAGGGAPLGGNGCAGGACQNPQCKPLGTAADPGQYPEIGFETQPSYIPNDTIVPTFDDVPDGANVPPDPMYGAGSWTKQDLQFFDQNKMHVDFFINTNNWCGDVTQDDECTSDIVDILTLHNPANHTIHHIHMGTAPTAGVSPPDGCNDATSCGAEMSGVETIINTMSHGGRPHLTRFRAPYGEPYQTQGAGLNVVEPVVAQYAVAVGWNLDSGDSANGTFTGQQIAQNVENLVGTGPGKGTNWGILLQHGTYPWTHDALPLLYGPNGYFAQHGFKLATVEDVICWKFGKHSWEIVQDLTKQPRQPN